MVVLESIALYEAAATGSVVIQSLPLINIARATRHIFTTAVLKLRLGRENQLVIDQSKCAVRIFV